MRLAYDFYWFKKNFDSVTKEIIWWVLEKKEVTSTYIDVIKYILWQSIYKWEKDGVLSYQHKFTLRINNKSLSL